MATSEEFVQYVCDQIGGRWSVRPRKMFGDYMIYINEKPILLLCDGTLFVKQLPPLAEHLRETGIPYPGAKPHYILDIDDRDLVHRVISILEPLTPLPRRKRTK